MYFDNDIQKLMLAETVERQHNVRELMDTLSFLIKSAATLADGTPVFRNADMQVFTESGHCISSEELSNIKWNSDAPSYEKYLALKMRVELLDQQIATLKSYKNDVLGYIRMRMNDHSNPPSMKEMQVFQSILKDSS